MKLYGHGTGTNPRRVTIYLAEKGISIPRVDMDLAAGEHRTAEFLAKNPAGKVPVLELDDGTYLPESAAIVEYLEEVFPDPPLLGRDAATRGRTRACERVVSTLIDRTGPMLHNSLPFFASRGPQNVEFANALRPLVEQQLAMLEAAMGERPFVAGDNVSVADCSLFALFQTCRVRLDMPFGEAYPKLDAWYERFAQRPSAAYE